MPGMTPDEFGNFIGELTGDPKAAALAKEVAIDLEAAQDKIRVPEDAGEYAADFEAILRRIPRGHFHSIDCGPGWYPLLSRLAKKLEEVDPEGLVEVYQVKEKFAGLRVYAGTDMLPCCRAVGEAYRAEHPRPEHPKPGEKPSKEYEAYWEQRSAVLEAHRATEEHKVLAAKAEARYADVAQVIDELEQGSFEVCEETGEPGVVMCSSGWLRTLDPVTAPDRYKLSEPEDELINWQVKHAAGHRGKLEAIVRQLTHKVAHQQVVMGRLLTALRAERNSMRSKRSSEVARSRAVEAECRQDQAEQRNTYQLLERIEDLEEAGRRALNECDQIENGEPWWHNLERVLSERSQR